MKYYKKTSIVSDFDKDIFANKLEIEIQNIQNMGMEVEIQYSTCTHNGICVYSALILGYEET